MAEAVRGNKLIYLYRVHAERTEAEAAALAFTTENSESYSADSDSTETKDGAIVTPGAAEVEITATSVLTKNDPLIPKLKNALATNGLMDIWKANLEEPGATEGTFKGTYYQGYLTELEISSPADDFVEVSLTFAINGTGADGDVTVNAEQQEIATYIYSDTTKEMACSKSAMTIAAGGNDTATLTNEVGTVTVESDNDKITGTVSNHTLTVSVASGATSGGIVTLTDEGGRKCQIVVTLQASA